MYASVTHRVAFSASRLTVNYPCLGPIINATCYSITALADRSEPPQLSDVGHKRTKR